MIADLSDIASWVARRGRDGARYTHLDSSNQPVRSLEDF